LAALKAGICERPLASSLAQPSQVRQGLSSTSSRHCGEDAASRASELQLETERRELQCSVLALVVKFGLVGLGGVSLVNLSIAYQQRLDRHSELAAVVDVETGKLRHLQQRFDRLFTLGGDQRLMDEQDQWIEPNRLRVIWR
jgi:hypothetical protein